MAHFKVQTAFDETGIIRDLALSQNREFVWYHDHVELAVIDAKLGFPISLLVYDFVFSRRATIHRDGNGDLAVYPEHLDSPFKHFPGALLQVFRDRSDVNQPSHIPADPAHIRVDFDELDWPESGKTIDLFHLRRLFVSHGDILKYLRAPVLQEIGFFVNEEEPEEDLPHLQPFVARSGCTLRKLSFRGTPIPRSVTEILRQYPSIIELVVVVLFGQSRSAGDLISMLTIPNADGCAAMSPHLSRISFGSYDDSSIDYGLYLHMLQSRWQAEDCGLTGAALVIDSEIGPDAATLRGFDLLRRDGMKGAEAVNVMEGWVQSPTWN
ncbi:hypothetical protein C8R44DRAFT_875757 [Mycena epipterygia]|nr:hypothetical protein C8R44DRAFT_875757 [Mycena epipterygia]